MSRLIISSMYDMDLDESGEFSTWSSVPVLNDYSDAGHHDSDPEWTGTSESGDDDDMELDAAGDESGENDGEDSLPLRGGGFAAEMEIEGDFECVCPSCPARSLTR